MSTLSDNCVYFGKVRVTTRLTLMQIKVYRWYNDQEDYLLSQVNAVTTIIGLGIDLVNEVIILAIKWRRRPELTLNELISGKKVWFL